MSTEPPIRKQGGHWTTATERMIAARAVKQEAVTRELLWACIGSRLWPSHLAEPTKPQENFPYLLCIHSPAGQIIYRVRTDEVELFSHLTVQANDAIEYTAGDKLATLLSLAEFGW